MRSKPRITLTWKPVRVQLPQLPSAKTSRVFTKNPPSPFIDRDGNILPWLDKAFPSSPIGTLEKARIPSFADNSMLFRAMGGRKQVRRRYCLTPLQIRHLTALALKHSTLFTRSRACRTLFVVTNPSDGKMYLIGISWKKNGFVPYIFTGDELSRAWCAGSIIFRLVW